MRLRATRAASLTAGAGIYIPPVPSIPVNTVAPSLVGSPVVGSVLTFNPGSWSGYPAPTFAYQLKRDGVNIAGSSPYTVLEADYGTSMTLEVTASNSEGSAAATSAGATVIGYVPANTVAPVASGSNGLGDTITVSTGTWDGYPAIYTYAYQWTRGGVDISGATSISYAIVAGDSAASLACRVTASNAQGAGSPVVSNTITAQTFTAPVVSVLPSVSGSTGLGNVLTATNGTWSGNPASYTYTRQWTRNNVAISGATASNYTLVAGDSAAEIRCQVLATNAIGPSAPASSAATNVQTFTAPAITGLPTIAGTATVGQLLTATPASATGNPTPTRTWQWVRGGVDISGATSSTYTLVTADGGTNVSVRQIEANGISSASATSAVVAVPPAEIIKRIFGTAAPYKVGSTSLLEDAIAANISALGPELVVNGDFSNGLTGWSVTGDGTATVVNGAANVVSNGGVARFFQSVPNVDGKAYRISAKVSYVGSGDGVVWVRHGNSNGDYRFGPLTQGNFDIAVVASGVTGFIIASELYQSGSTAIIDNISIKEIDLTKCRAFTDPAGTTPVYAVGQPVGLILDESGNVKNWTNPASSTNRPILKLDANSKYNLYTDGLDDWLETGVIDPAGATEATVVLTSGQLTGKTVDTCLFEFGPNSGTTAGTFGLFAPAGGFTKLIGLYAMGTTAQSLLTDAGGFSIGEKKVISASVNLTTGVMRLRVNGVAVATQTVTLGGTFSTQKAYVGRRAGTSAPAKINEYGHTLVFGPVTDTDLAALEAKHAEKAGITL